MTSKEITIVDFLLLKIGYDFQAQFDAPNYGLTFSQIYASTKIIDLSLCEYDCVTVILMIYSVAAIHSCCLGKQCLKHVGA